MVYQYQHRKKSFDTKSEAYKKLIGQTENVILKYVEVKVVQVSRDAGNIKGNQRMEVSGCLTVLLKIGLRATLDKIIFVISRYLDCRIYTVFTGPFRCYSD